MPDAHRNRFPSLLPLPAMIKIDMSGCFVVDGSRLTMGCAIHRVVSRANGGLHE